MRYVSTRDDTARASGAQAIVSGLAPDGGLYFPEHMPRFAPEGLAALLTADYPTRAAHILAQWLTDFALPDLLGMCRAAYAGFDLPVKALGDGLHALELFHGPTLAFKDVALQLLPHLLKASGEFVGESRDILILVATSGDTGKAALEGFADVPGVSICVFYPEGGVSEAQRLQMVTQTGDNTRVVAVRGNFDDAQTGVKKIFTDPAIAALLDERGVVLSSANSINLGRLLPQIAYYCSAYLDMVKAGSVAMGDEINICVPTGNFGNILAAHFAREMGLPVHTLVCASNVNNVLTDFMRTGVYDRNRAFHLTTSPSMDILISSNLERLLFELSDRDDGQVRGFMAALSSTGQYRLTGAALERLQAGFWAGFADEQAVADEIKQTFAAQNYLIDPHTAVAFRIARDYRAATGDARPMLVTATASPYKFGRAVLEALAGAAVGDDFACCDQLAALSGQQTPEAIAALKTRPVRHRAICDIADMWGAIEPIWGQNS